MTGPPVRKMVTPPEPDPGALQHAPTNVIDTTTKVKKLAIKQPPVKGSKLYRFKHHKSNSRDGEAESGMQVYVLRARIEGQEYALKVVRVQPAAS